MYRRFVVSGVTSLQQMDYSGLQKTIDVTYLYGDWRLAGTFQSDSGQQECPSSRDYHGWSAVVVASRLPCPEERLLAEKTSETQAAAQRGRTQEVCFYLCVICFAIPKRMEVSDIVHT
jgi:hypothetical protein